MTREFVKKSDDITVRDVSFNLDDAPRVWFRNNAGVSSYFDALSILTTQGERAVIRSVWRYRNKISDPVLQIEIDKFKAQEAMHTREHENYNRRLRDLGYDVDVLQAKQMKTINWLETKFGPDVNLAVTVCMEHFTSIMSKLVTADPRFFGDAHPSFRDIWTWHAVEEAEHCTVAFDLLRVVRPGYFFRCGVMSMTSFLFLRMLSRNFNSILKTDGNRFSLRIWSDLLKYFYYKPGFLRRILLPYLAFYLPNFYPERRGFAPFTVQFLKRLTSAAR